MKRSHFVGVDIASPEDWHEAGNSSRSERRPASLPRRGGCGQSAIEGDGCIAVAELAVIDGDLFGGIAAGRIERIEMNGSGLSAVRSRGDFEREVRCLQCAGQVRVDERACPSAVEIRLPLRETRGRAAVPLFPLRLRPRSRKTVSNSPRSRDWNFDGDAGRAGHRIGAEAAVCG